MSNTFIKQQCENMIMSIKLFEQSCEMSARKDDGKISKEESKTLNHITKAGEKYRRTLKLITEK